MLLDARDVRTQFAELASHVIQADHVGDESANARWNQFLNDLCERDSVPPDLSRADSCTAAEGAQTSDIALCAALSFLISCACACRALSRSFRSTSPVIDNWICCAARSTRFARRRTALSRSRCSMTVIRTTIA